MKRSFVGLSLLLAGLVAVSGQQGGSLFWSNVQPLLKQKTEEFDKIAASFEFYRVGDASRIGYGDNPRLAGVRIGPYLFPARRKGSTGRYTFELRIETRIVFLNKAGNKASIQKAVDVREDVTAITIRPLPPAEYFTPTRD